MVAETMTTESRPAAGDSAVMRVRELTQTFGDSPRALEVLHGVDLEIRSGELTLIMGPSGSGKTTLLTIMGLLLRPTRGAVEFRGCDLTECPEPELPVLRRRCVTFVFQAFNLLSAMTALENVQLAVELQGTRGRWAAVAAMDLLRRVGLADRAGHRPAELSCGQKQRVAVARALASPAPLVLADEPTGNLDAASAHQVMELLRDLVHTEGRAVVVVTHDQRWESLADRIIRLEDGRITADLRERRP